MYSSVVFAIWFGSIHLRGSALLLRRNLTGHIPPATQCHSRPACTQQDLQRCSCAPNLFLIGSERVASTSFFLDVEKSLRGVNVGRDAPWVYFPYEAYSRKEKCYFDYAYCEKEAGMHTASSVNMDRYLNLWRPSEHFICEQGADHIRADFSVTYMADMRVPERIASFYKGAPVRPRFMIMVRDPVDRYFSTWSHWKARKILDTTGIPSDVDPNTLEFRQYASYQMKHFESCMPDPRQLESNITDGIKLCMQGGDDAKGLLEGFYADLLDLWLRHFEPNQFIVLSTASYLKNTGPVMNTVASYLGISQIRNKMTSPSAFEFDHLANEVKQTMDLATRKQLNAFYAPYNQRFFKTLQKAQKEGLQIVGGVHEILEGWQSD